MRDWHALARARSIDCPGPLPTPCWIWQGAKTGSGYARIGVDGRPATLSRLLLGLVSGDGLVARHDCDHPSCVNPQHLRRGTHADNMRDAFSRGRLTLPPPCAEMIRNSARTACVKGHAFDSINTYRSKKGERVCRACHREREQRRRDRLHGVGVGR